MPPILPRQGEVARDSETEGADSATLHFACHLAIATRFRAMVIPGGVARM